VPGLTGAVLGGGGAQVEAARVYRTTNYSIPNNVETALPWEFEDFDTADFWAIGDPTHLTAPIKGIYVVLASCRWDSTAHRYDMYILGPGVGDYVADTSLEAAPAGFVWFSCSGLVELDAGEQVRLVFYQNSGAGKIVMPWGPNTPTMSIALLRET